MVLQMKTTKNTQNKWLYIPDHPYRILTTGGSGSGKTNAFLHLIKEQGDIDEIYLYAKDLSKSKYEFLIKNVNMQEQNISVIQMHLLSVQMQWMTFMRILMTTNQTGKKKKC